MTHKLYELPSFSIIKIISDGPLSAPVNTQCTWLIEIHITNIGKGRISNVVMADLILLDVIENVQLNSISKGCAIFVGNSITWSIGDLAIGEKAVIQVKLTGSFSSEGKHSIGVANVSGLDPILDTIVGGPATGYHVSILESVS